jgi:FtsH-binding integral membrane protein
VARPGSVGAIGTGVMGLPEAKRADFLRSVGAWTAGGIIWAFIVGGGVAWVLSENPFLLNRIFMLGAIFGSMAVSNYAARPLVNGHNPELGFLIGTAAEGIAMGYLLYFAVMVGADSYGDEGLGPFTLVAQAGGLTALTAMCMGAWLATGPKDLSMIQGALAVLGVPMMVLMVISFVFPIGGAAGIGLTAVFIAVSGAGLLYNLNQVIHVARPGQEIAAAYEITMGMLVLFWNILVLLMKLSRRD